MSTVHWPIIRRLLLTPGRVAAADDRREYRGIELLIGAMHLAAEIERRSSTPTVGIMLPTSGLFPMAALAVWMLGRIPVPISYLLKHEEAQYIVDDCGTDIVLTAGPLMEATGFTPTGVSVVKVEELNFRAVPEMRWPAGVWGAHGDEVAVLLYTSGTSGKPKGVMLTHDNLRSNIAQIRRHARLTSADVFLAVLPQFHSSGFTLLTLLPLTIGAKVVYTARFVPAQIVRLFRQHKPTLFMGVPSMYNALLSVKQASPEDFASLRLAVSGGEPLPQAIAERVMERLGVRINEGYGLTETSPVTNWCIPEEYRARSVGRAVPDLSTLIVDPATDGELCPGAEGEIRFRGPNVMKGYYRLPDITAAAFDSRGYFRTGDLGRLDREGFLYITGRLKDLIIIAGENVAPREIEEVLNRAPGVGESVVVGQMDESRGEVPIAFVEPAEGAAIGSLDASALRAHCREFLAPFKVPREVRIVEKLPRNPTGKVLRRELKEWAKQKQSTTENTE